MAVSKFYFSIAGVAVAVLGVFLLGTLLFGAISSVFRKDTQNRSQKKLSVKLDKLAAEQGLVYTDQLYYAPCGVSLSVDRRARKAVISRIPYLDPVVLDLGAIVYFSVQNDLEAFRELKDRYWDAVTQKVLHQEAVILAYKNTVGKPIASITLHTREREIQLPFFINENYNVNKNILDESGRAMAQFVDLLNDVFKEKEIVCGRE